MAQLSTLQHFSSEMFSSYKNGLKNLERYGRHKLDSMILVFLIILNSSYIILILLYLAVFWGFVVVFNLYICLEPKEALEEFPSTEMFWMHFEVLFLS